MHLMVCLAGYDNASETKKHDADAVRYLSYVLYPLLAGYAVYALFYETHKSWYSFILNTLVGAVYMFGFILMCPQVGPSLPPPLLPPPLGLFCCLTCFAFNPPSLICPQVSPSCLPLLSLLLSRLLSPCLSPAHHHLCATLCLLSHEVVSERV